MEDPARYKETSVWPRVAVLCPPLVLRRALSWPLENDGRVLSSSITGHQGRRFSFLVFSIFLFLLELRRRRAPRGPLARAFRRAEGRAIEPRAIPFGRRKVAVLNDFFSFPLFLSFFGHFKSI